MKVVEPSHQLIYPTIRGEFISECALIELAGRTCYKSEERITESSWKEFCSRMVRCRHDAMLEFGSMMVRFVTDRGISHELVRHRLCSFAQESTRYCNYSDDKFNNEVTFIQPLGITHNPDNMDYRLWVGSCEQAEAKYLTLLVQGISPQVARSVLPNCTKTEIVVKANFREWRHILSERAHNPKAHPDMRRLMIPLYNEVRALCPTIFDMGDCDPD